jgi:hypothetical protein
MSGLAVCSSATAMTSELALFAVPSLLELQYTPGMQVTQPYHCSTSALADTACLSCVLVCSGPIGAGTGWLARLQGM